MSGSLQVRTGSVILGVAFLEANEPEPSPSNPSAQAEKKRIPPRAGDTMMRLFFIAPIFTHKVVGASLSANELWAGKSPPVVVYSPPPQNSVRQTATCRLPEHPDLERNTADAIAPAMTSSDPLPTTMRWEPPVRNPCGEDYPESYYPTAKPASRKEDSINFLGPRFPTAAVTSAASVFGGRGPSERLGQSP
jgi:hypothetical protein